MQKMLRVFIRMNFGIDSCLLLNGVRSWNSNFHWYMNLKWKFDNLVKKHTLCTDILNKFFKKVKKNQSNLYQQCWEIITVFSTGYGCGMYTFTGTGRSTKEGRTIQLYVLKLWQFKTVNRYKFRFTVIFHEHF